jgi:hypothetical protein
VAVPVKAGGTLGMQPLENIPNKLT